MARRDLTGAVDFGWLETYAGGDAALVEEVLELFIEQVDGWSRLLDAPGETWRDAAHTLKGAALAVGARPLGAACDAAEAAGATVGMVERARLSAAIRDAAAAALADVAAYRHQRLLDGLRAPPPPEGPGGR